MCPAPVLGSDLGRGRGEVLGHRRLSKQALPGPLAGISLWETAGLPGVLDGLHGEDRYNAGPFSAPVPKASHPDLPTETLPVLWVRMCSVGTVSWGFFPVLLNPL